MNYFYHFQPFLYYKKCARLKEVIRRNFDQCAGHLGFSFFWNIQFSKFWKCADFTWIVDWLKWILYWFNADFINLVSLHFFSGTNNSITQGLTVFLLVQCTKGTFLPTQRCNFKQKDLKKFFFLIIKCPTGQNQPRSQILFHKEKPHTGLYNNDLRLGSHQRLTTKSGHALY